MMPDNSSSPAVVSSISDGGSSLEPLLEEDRSVHVVSDHDLGTSIQVKQRLSGMNGSFIEDDRLYSSRLIGNNESWINLFKAFCGTSTLFMPRYFYRAGILPGVLINVVSAGLSIYCMKLLMTAKVQVERLGQPVKSYKALAEVTCGYYGRVAVEWMYLVSNIGVAAVYTLFAASNAQSLIKSATDCSTSWSEIVFVLLSVPILVPMVLLRDLTHLAVPSLLVLYISSYNANKLYTDGAGDWQWLGKFDGILMFFGTGVYEFEGVPMVIPIGNSMQNPDKLPRMTTVVIFLTACLQILSGVTGCLLNGSNSTTLSINNLSETAEITMILHAALATVALATLPMFFYPASVTLDVMLTEWKPRALSRSAFETALRLAIVVVVVLIAVLASDWLDNLVSIIGGVCSVPLMVVFPPLIFLRANTGQLSSRHELGMKVLVAFGCACAVVSTVMAVYAIAVPDPEPSQPDFHCPEDKDHGGDNERR